MTNADRQELIDNQLQLLAERSKMPQDLESLRTLTRAMAEMVIVAIAHQALPSTDAGDVSLETLLKGVL